MKLKLTFDINTLTVEEQKELYLFLKAKFETKIPSDSSKPDVEINSKAALIAIENVGFSTKAFYFLRAMKIHSLIEICQFSTFDLLKQRGLGKRTVMEIESVLADYGLSLKKE